MFRAQCHKQRILEHVLDHIIALNDLRLNLYFPIPTYSADNPSLEHDVKI